VPTVVSCGRQVCRPQAATLATIVHIKDGRAAMREDITRLLDNVDRLFTLPEVYLRLRELHDDPSSGIPDFARVVATDAALAARVLRIANSALFGFASRIDRLDRALTLMGTSQLHDLVLASTAIDRLCRISSGSLDMTLFWRRSIECAVLARCLAERRLAVDSERYFLMGLLHDVGHLVLLQTRAGDLDAILAESARSGESLLTLERRKLGYDYGQVGAALLERWRLPEPLCAAVGHHLHPHRDDPHAFEAAILHIAVFLAPDYQGQHASLEDLALDPQALAVCPFDLEELAEVRAVCAAGVAEAISLIMPGPRQAGDVPAA
jgi:HD-like signal output (HDOD) protein